MLAALENKKMIDDAEIIKKPWTCGRSGANRLRANSPPTESFIIYDESSSPCTDAYLIDADYPIETYIKPFFLQ